MIASDLPWVAGLLVAVAFAFWLVGRLADSGRLSGPRHPVFGVILAIVMAGWAASGASFRPLWTTALFGMAALFLGLSSARDWYRLRAGRRG